MKKILFLLVLFSAAVGLAQNIDELFRSANNFYSQKNYDKAAALYEELVSSGYEGESLFYNLGNAYYRTGKLGYAILYYEKALKLAPGDEDILHNINVARAKTTDKIPEFPPFFLFRIWEEILGLFSLRGWIYTGYIFFILLLIAVGGYLLFRNPLNQKYSFFAAIAAGVIFVLSVSVTIVKYNRDVNIIKGVIVERISNVKSSPDESGNDSFVIHEGLKVTLEDNLGDWVKVRLDDGKSGWIKENHIRII